METFETKIQKKMDNLDIESNFIQYLINVNQYGEDDFLTKFSLSKFLAHKFLVEEPNIIFNEHVTIFNNMIAIFDLLGLESGPEIIELNGGNGKKGRNQSRQMSRRPHKKMSKSRRSTRKARKRLNKVNRRANRRVTAKDISEHKQEMRDIKKKRELDKLFKDNRGIFEKLGDAIKSVFSEPETGVYAPGLIDPAELIKNGKPNVRKIKSFVRAARNQNYLRRKRMSWRRLGKQVSPLLIALLTLLFFQNFFETTNALGQGPVQYNRANRRSVVSGNNTGNNVTNSSQVNIVSNANVPSVRGSANVPSVRGSANVPSVRGSVNNPYTGMQIRDANGLARQFQTDPGVNMTRFREIKTEIDTDLQQTGRLTRVARYMEPLFKPIDKYLLDLYGNNTAIRQQQLNELKQTQNRIQLERALVKQIGKSRGNPDETSVLYEQVRNGTYPVKLVRKVVTDMQTDIHGRRFRNSDFERIMEDTMRDAIEFNKKQCENQLSELNTMSEACKNTEMFSEQFGGITDVGDLARKYAERLQFELPFSVSRHVNEETGEVITTIHTPEVSKLKILRSVLVNSVVNDVDGDLRDLVSHRDFTDQLPIEQFSQIVESRIYDKIKHRMQTTKVLQGNTKPLNQFLPTGGDFYGHYQAETLPDEVDAIRVVMENEVNPNEQQLNTAVDRYVEKSLSQREAVHNLATTEDGSTTYGHLFKKAINKRLVYDYLTETIKYLDTQSSTLQQQLLGEQQSNVDNPVASRGQFLSNPHPEQAQGGETKAVVTESRPMTQRFMSVQTAEVVMAELDNAASINTKLKLLERKAVDLARNANFTESAIDRNIVTTVVGDVAREGKFNPQSGAQQFRDGVKGTSRWATGTVTDVVSGAGEAVADESIKFVAGRMVTGFDQSDIVVNRAFVSAQNFANQARANPGSALIIIMGAGVSMWGVLKFGGEFCGVVRKTGSMLVYIAERILNPLTWYSTCKSATNRVQSADQIVAQRRKLLNDINEYRTKNILQPLNSLEGLRTRSFLLDSEVGQSAQQISPQSAYKMEKKFRSVSRLTPIIESPPQKQPQPPPQNQQQSPPHIGEAKKGNPGALPNVLDPTLGQNPDHIISRLSSQVASTEASADTSAEDTPEARQSAAQPPQSVERKSDTTSVEQSGRLPPLHVSLRMDTPPEFRSVESPSGKRKGGGRKKRRKKRTRKKRRKKRTKRKRRKRNKRTRRKK